MPVLTVAGNIVARKDLVKKQKVARGKKKFKSRKRERFIYCLELEDGKYYVGQSVDVEKRIQQHREGKGAVWTKKYPLVSVLNILPLGKVTSKEAQVFENDMTIGYAVAYGTSNVRGGDYCGHGVYHLAKKVME